MDKSSEKSGKFGREPCLVCALILFAFEMISFALALCRQQEILHLQNLINTDLALKSGS